jgi:halogenation protein CepH
MAHLVQGDSETALLSLISQCPLIAELLSGAKRVTEGPYGEIRARKDYSYCHTRFWRPGMVLIGDSACFIDPVFSSGVHLATYSALLAARSINSCLAELLDEERAFEEFEKRYRMEYGNFYEFLLAFYDVHVDEHSYFWTAKKVTNCTADETTAFVELVGGIASNDAALSVPAVRKQFARSSRELAATVERLFDPASESENPVFAAPIVDRVMHAGAQIQAQAMLGADAEREGPAFPNGLVASEDGVHWVPASP